jgi:peptidoglycan/LPS O-acetylase OafA/YrhL
VDATSRSSNFDSLRILAAASVVFSHAFLIADGHEKNEPFVRLTGNILGIHGVFVFLIISGFLVARSLANSSLINFAWKRLLRIYPGLLLCAFVCALLISPFYSHLPAKAYLMSTDAARYIAKVLLLYDVTEIPTVEFYNDNGSSLRVGFNINGSLWSIACELYCYIFLAALAALELANLRIALTIVLVGTAVFALTLANKISVSGLHLNLLYTTPSFFAGVAMYLINERYGLSLKIALACLVAFVLIIPTGYLMVLFPIIMAYPLAYFGQSAQPISLLNQTTRFGDLSYGTYLFGWPVEQVIRSLAETTLSGFGLFLISLPLSLFCGWASWHLVEKRTLAMKGWFRGSLSPLSRSDRAE